MRIICLCNNKGGVGKTTSTVNIGAGLNRLGKRVLLVDMDSQGMLSSSLGIEANKLDKTIYNLLIGEATIKEIIIDINGLKILPSSLSLSNIEKGFSGEIGKELLLKKALKSVKDFDYILVDSPPSLSILTVNCLVFTEEVYIPMVCEYLALQGLNNLLKTIDKVKDIGLNKDLKVSGIILNRYDGRKILNREVVETVKDYFSNKVFKTIIRENISLAESPSYSKSIYEYKSKSYGAEDYMNLCKEIIKRS